MESIILIGVEVMKKMLSAISFLIVLTGIASAWAEVTIDWTRVPSAGAGSESQGDIAGVVRGLANPEKYKIILYAHTDWWYVQPLGDAPYTDIGNDGRWSNWTHLGHRYAVLVVRPSFQPDAKTQSLPKVGGDVVARSEISAGTDHR